MNAVEKKETGRKIIENIKLVFDPEIPVNVYEIGLIYEINISDDANIQIVMTLTSPNCPVAESLPQEVKEIVEKVKGVNKVEIELTFDPPGIRKCLVMRLSWRWDCCECRIMNSH